VRAEPRLRSRSRAWIERSRSHRGETCLGESWWSSVRRSPSRRSRMRSTCGCREPLGVSAPEWPGALLQRRQARWYRLPVGFQNSATAADQRFSSRGLVLVDQAADNRSTSDPAVDRLEDGRFRTWRAQLQCSVRPMSVVMHRIPVKYAAQVSFPEDQRSGVSSVRTVNPRRSAKQFARGHRGGILTTSMPAPASTASNEAVT
jgi:hypothetical protein